VKKISVIKRNLGWVADRFLFLDWYLADQNAKIISCSGIHEASGKQKRYFIYGTWSNSGFLKEYEKALLLKLQKRFVVVVITNGKVIDPWLKQESIPYVHRKNVGRDLGQLRDFFRLIISLDIEIDLLVWANSSVYWNYDELIYLFDNMILKELDNYPVLSLTDSFQANYHLQSYFFVFDKSFIEMARSKNLSLPFRNTRYKRTLIHYGERNFSKWLENIGINSNAIFSITSLVAKDFHHYNAPMDLSKKLLYSGFPGFKVSSKKGLWERKKEASEFWTQKIFLD
jgi:hypothetical protein